MNKVYVDVVAEFSKEGCLIPILFVWEDGRKYKIDKILKIERCASRKAGGVGTMYTCMVQGKERRLYKMARKSRKSIPETVSSAAVQEEIKRPFRAGLYARISMETEETIERGTIETQVELMKNYVADTEDISVAEVYKDSDYSGTNFDRPGFTQMMEDIKHGKINCVIVKDLSRLGRNYVETSNYIERVFPFFHVRFLAVTDDFDSFREGVDLTVPLKNIINEFYSKDLAKKSSSAKKSIVERRKIYRCLGTLWI